ncbi:cAMP-binding protein [Fulvivirga imtechensis AK7]|uniref:cAMP-binding protein n=2 Tax=Fulvivirga TaxID=396811 RepID=L8JQ13_9BACT|nr:cAMP-binding protein [Fulvivirga imtechensis AK7]
MIIDQEKCIGQFREALNRYAPVSEESLSKLLSIAKFTSIEKGHYLLQLNQVAKSLYFVCEGIITSLFVTQDGNTHIKNFFLEGNFAASTVSLLLSCPSSFALECLEDGIILSLNFKKYKQLINENDDLKNFYTGYLEQKWVIENEKRQISFATQTAMERYLTFLKNYTDLESRVPQRHIASYLGITPTQLSRIRKDLKK